MGICISKKRTQASAHYSVQIGPDRPGETRTLRNPKHAKSLLSKTSEGFTTIFQSVQAAFRRYRERPLFGTRVDGQYQWMTYGEVEPWVYQLGTALCEVCPRTNEELVCVGIISRNRKEWCIADFACALYGRVSVPLYETLGAQAMAHIIKQTAMQAVICSVEAAVRLLKLHAENRFPALKKLILMDPANAEITAAAKEGGLMLIDLREMYHKGATVQQPSPSRPEDIFTICYTSGTTGEAKGAQISHFCMMIGIQSLCENIVVDSTDVHYSFLPAAHMFERNCIHQVLYRGASAGFSSGDPMKLFDDLAVLRPTYFGSVPRLFKRMHDMLKAAINSMPAAEKQETLNAIATKIASFRRSGVCTDPQLDDKYFSAARAKLGGRVKICVSGGSAIARDVLEFLKVNLCCPILEGYGQTEVPGSISVTHPKDTETGHVGGPNGGVEVKLVDVPDLGYFSHKQAGSRTEDPAGEICVRGPNVFQGYFKAPELTQAAFDADGWLHTGDIGVLQSSGTIRIVDRRKHIFKLSQGEYISPEKVEQALSNCPLIAQSWVHGETIQDYLLAFIVLDEPGTMKWAAATGLAGDFAAVAKSEAMEKFLREQIKALAGQFALNSLEVPKKIKVLTQAFGVEQGLITPTLKLRRGELKQAFAQEIAALYAS